MAEVESPPAESKPSVTNRQARWLGGTAFIVALFMAAFHGFTFYEADKDVIDTLFTAAWGMIMLAQGRNVFEYFAPKK